MLTTEYRQCLHNDRGIALTTTKGETTYYTDSCTFCMPIFKEMGYREIDYGLIEDVWETTCEARDNPI